MKTQTQTKNQKSFKIFLFFCFCLFHEPFRVQGPSGVMNPCFTQALSGAYENTNTNKKVLKFFCFFVFVCFTNHSGFKDPRGIINPCFLEHSSGVVSIKPMKNIGFFVIDIVRTHEGKVPTSN
jgi:hypothetical protein